MKLIDLLKENEEEGGVKRMQTEYDIAIVSDDVKAAAKAFENIKNYDRYAQNLRDPKMIKKIFGPSIPAQKAKAAWSDWDERSDDEKSSKIIDIKNRVPEAWDEVLSKTEDDYKSWKAEGNEGSINDYLISLDGKQLPKSLVGKYGKNYFPMKTPDNLKKYSGKMEEGVHFIVKDNKVIFPTSMENPYNTKPYLTKVIKTIMDNSGVDYKIVKIESDVEDGEEARTVEKPKKEKTPPLSYTADDKDKAEKVRAKFKKELGEVPTAKYEIVPVEDGEDRKYKLIVTGLSPDQREKLFKFKTTLKEEISAEYEKYLLMRRAGIIK